MRVLKRLVLGLLTLVILAAGAGYVFFYVVHPKKRAATDAKAPTTPEAIERGRYLANAIAGCVGCHSPIDETRPGDFPVEGKQLTGRVFKGGGLPGVFSASNLTADPDTGLGKWTDGEILRAMREGVSKDGRPLFPLMPYTNFRMFPDEDALAIIAYLRTIPAQKSTLPKTKVDFPVAMFARMAPKPLEAAPAPWPTEQVARGKMLLQVMSCTDCHSQREKGEIIAGKEFSGGPKFQGPFGTVYARNITPDPTGIGGMTDDQLMKVFREGIGKDNRPLWVMPWSFTQQATDEDLRALIAGLKTLKPIANVVPADDLYPTK
jgi:mono/diheme cytochrome c family protein